MLKLVSVFLSVSVIFVLTLACLTILLRVLYPPPQETIERLFRLSLSQLSEFQQKVVNSVEVDLRGDGCGAKIQIVDTSEIPTGGAVAPH